jgi:hypothetical protein
MIGLSQLDAVCVRHMVGDVPITFSFGGADYVGTAIGWRTEKELTEGGFHADIQPKQILVDPAQYGSAAQPGEKAVLSVCVDGNGVPCAVDSAVGSRVRVRVQAVGRAGGGITYTVRAETRG